MSKTYKIAAVGDRDSVYGFAALGLDTYFIGNGNDATACIQRLAKEKTAVIYLTEPLAEAIPEVLEKYREKATPAIIPIPSVSGSTGYGRRVIQEAMIKAVGTDLTK
ncbi:MAG: V-type ATP synthase subunit F [Ruminococcus sp.]|nr:V-type ATP synthase subunit F [Ruminococcus sp.]